MGLYTQNQVSNSIVSSTRGIIESLREAGELGENQCEFHYLIKDGGTFCIIPPDDWGNPGYVIALQGDYSSVVEVLPAQEHLH